MRSREARRLRLVFTQRYVVDRFAAIGEVAERAFAAWPRFVVRYRPFDQERD